MTAEIRKTWSSITSIRLEKNSHAIRAVLLLDSLNVGQLLLILWIELYALLGGWSALVGH